jgi:hypothetical protein
MAWSRDELESTFERKPRGSRQNVGRVWIKNGQRIVALRPYAGNFPAQPRSDGQLAVDLKLSWTKYP